MVAHWYHFQHSFALSVSPDSFPVFPFTQNNLFVSAVFFKFFTQNLFRFCRFFPVFLFKQTFSGLFKLFSFFFKLFFCYFKLFVYAFSNFFSAFVCVCVCVCVCVTIMIIITTTTILITIILEIITGKDLLVLHTRMIVHESVVESFQKIENLGREQAHTFFSKRIKDCTILISEKVLKNKLCLFNHQPQKNRPHTQKELTSVRKIEIYFLASIFHVKSVTLTLLSFSNMKNRIILHHYRFLAT